MRKIKNGYCSRLCLFGMQIHVLKYLRKTRAKRAQKTATNHMRKGECPYIFPSLSEISVPQRQAGFKQTAIPRHSAPTAAEREAKAANNNPLSVPNPLSDSRPKQPIRAGAEYAKSLAYKSYAAARLQPSLKHSRRSSASPPHPPYGRQSKRRCKRFATVPKILPENPPNWHFQNLASFSQIKF